jgi:hemerythrin
MNTVENGARQRMGQKRENKVRLCFKEKKKYLYVHFKKHHGDFMEEGEPLCELHHPNHMEHVEGFIKLMTKIFQKDWTYCNTIKNKVSKYLAICIQSIGYRWFYQRLFQLTGFHVDAEFTLLHPHSEDQAKEW